MTNTNRAPMTRNVLRIDGHYYVQNLGDADGRILMYYYTSDESETPDIDSPTNSKMMHGALYDLAQCEDDIKNGDTFVTPHGLFVVRGYHVEPVVETKNKAKTRRAKIRRLEATIKAKADAEYAARKTPGVNFDNGAGGSF